MVEQNKRASAEGGHEQHRVTETHHETEHKKTTAKMQEEVHSERATQHHAASSSEQKHAAAGPSDQTSKTKTEKTEVPQLQITDRSKPTERGTERSKDTAPPPAHPGDGRSQRDKLEIPPVEGVIRDVVGDKKVAPVTFDKAKSVEDLIKEGKFKKPDGSDETRKDEPLEKDKAPKIKVVYEDHDNNKDAPKPDFIVNKDGSVQCVHNPEGPPPDKEIVVQVARDKAETGRPTPEQQAATDGLVGYLGERIQDKYGNLLKEVTGPDGKPVKQVDIEDLQNLVTDAVEHKLGANLPKEDLVPPDVRDISDQVDRVRGSNGGSHTFPRDGVDRTFPPREVPQPVDEPNPVAAMKDMTASLFNADKTHPYETVRTRSDGSYACGRYGINQGLMGSWLAELLGIDLGDPPDYSKLAKLLKENPELAKELGDKMQQLAKDGKVPGAFADKFQDKDFAANFAGFVDKLGGGKGEISANDVKNFLPKELQETVATDRIQSFEKKMGIDPNHVSDKDAGKVALSMFLGRVPDSNDMQNPQYQKYMDAAGNMFEIAKGRQTGLGDINVTDAEGKILAAANGDVGKAMWTHYMSDGNLGCAASVSEVLQQSGFSYANSAMVTGLRDQLLAHGWTMHKVSAGGYHPGDVIFGINQGSDGRSGGGSGHIGVIGTNGTVYDNSSSSQVWVHHNITASSWAPGNQRFGDQMWYLSPPGSA